MTYSENEHRFWMESSQTKKKLPKKYLKKKKPSKQTNKNPLSSLATMET